MKIPLEPPTLELPFYDVELELIVRTGVGQTFSRDSEDEK